MAKKLKENLPIMTQIREMKVGEVVIVPTTSILSVRANLSVYALQLGRKYTSHINRKVNPNRLEVTRVL